MGGGASRRRQGGKAGGAAASAALLSDTLRRRRRVLLGSDGPEPQPFELLDPLQQFVQFPQAAGAKTGTNICSCGSVLKDDTQFCRNCGVPRTVLSTFDKCACGSAFVGDTTFCRSCRQMRPPQPAMASDCVFDRIGISNANAFRRDSQKVCNVEGYLDSHSIELLGLGLATKSALSNRLFKIGQVGRSMPALQPVAASVDEAPKPLDEEQDPRAARPAMLTCYELLALHSAIRAGTKNDLLELLFCIFDVDEDDRVSMEDFEATIAGYLELEGATGLQGAELEEYKRVDPKERTLAARRVAELAIAKYSCGVELPPPDPSAPEASTAPAAPADSRAPAPGGLSEKADAAPPTDEEASADKEEVVSFETRGQQGLTIDDTGRVTKVARGPARKLGVFVGWHLILIDDQPFSTELFKQKQASVEACRITFRKVKPPVRSRRGMCSCLCGGRQSAADKKDGKNGKDEKKKPLIDETSDSEGQWAGSAGSSSDEGHKQRMKTKEEGGKVQQKRRGCFSRSPRRKANQSDKQKEKDEEQGKFDDDDEGIEAAAETEGASRKTEGSASQDAKASKSATPKAAPKRRRGMGCALCGCGKQRAPANPQPLTFEQWKKWFLENFGDFDLSESLGTAPVELSAFTGPADNISRAIPPQDVARTMMPQDTSMSGALLPQDMMLRNLPPQQTIAPGGLAPRGAPVGASTGIRQFDDDESPGDAGVFQRRQNPM